MQICKVAYIQKYYYSFSSPAPPITTYSGKRIAEASPNPGHDALAKMEKHLPEFTLITQNVDGYHIQAGSKKVLALHGKSGEILPALVREVWNSDGR